MGILDEAIRDHLELKRQHGAQSAELQRLEDEAFGPPARPGDPEFAEGGAAVAEATAPPRTEGDGDGESNGEAATAEEPVPGEPVLEEHVPEELVLEEPMPEAATLAGTGEAEAGDAESSEASVAADPSEAETSFYDQALDDELVVGDVDLAVEEELTEASAPEAADEPPIESLETVEHPLEPESGEHEAAAEPASDELPLEEPASDEVAVEEPPSEEAEAEEPRADEDGNEEGSAEAESSEEDVLADTPEFLRDAPEDDELWFEQGEPKDFDFD